MASNWQAAVLQLGSLVLFSRFLYQRGAPKPVESSNETTGEVNK